ncbi:hypothetical protein GXW78_17640 [Roseomonas terrae]|jgi:hypothetical protein|uniref:Uncharacterized protein n=1 Tax=Neoroseomonas terrae TaxID=424799 RepID=A0ABS5EKE2_9PROT|nr:hypothetical protein [Neoroseomonas terrae]MBR0651497.1 hypothetical protein [Neoroseomonas terrae]
MHPEIFSDGIGEITVSGSIVRVDLTSLSPTERNPDNTPRAVLRQRVIFSIEGFANSVDVMQKALQGLIDAGVVRRTDAAANGADRRAPASPNFR